MIITVLEFWPLSLWLIWGSSSFTQFPYRVACSAAWSPPPKNETTEQGVSQWLHLAVISTHKKYSETSHSIILENNTTPSAWGLWLRVVNFCMLYIHIYTALDMLQINALLHVERWSRLNRKKIRESWVIQPRLNMQAGDSASQHWLRKWTGSMLLAVTCCSSNSD